MCQFYLLYIFWTSILLTWSNIFIGSLSLNVKSVIYNFAFQNAAVASCWITVVYSNLLYYNANVLIHILLLKRTHLSADTFKSHGFCVRISICRRIPLIFCFFPLIFFFIKSLTFSYENLSALQTCIERQNNKHFSMSVCEKGKISLWG